MSLETGDLANGNPKTSTLHGDAYFAAATARPKIEGLRDIGILINSRRTASLHAIRGVASAYIDEDDSGTYDPKESQSKTTISQPRRTKKAKKGDGDGDPNQGQTRRDTQVGYSLPITFVLNSAKGRNYLRSISPGPFDDDSNNPEKSTESLNVDGGILFTRRQVKKPTRLGDEATRYAHISRKSDTAKNEVVLMG